MEDISREFEKLMSDSYKKMANEYCDKIKDSDVNMILNVNTCNDINKVKEKLLAEINNALKVIKDVDKIKYI